MTLNNSSHYPRNQVNHILSARWDARRAYRDCFTARSQLRKLPGGNKRYPPEAALGFALKPYMMCNRPSIREGLRYDKRFRRFSVFTVEDGEGNQRRKHSFRS